MRPDKYDPAEREYIRRALDRPGAVFLDIGANVGILTLFAMSQSRSDARLLAFEPHPVTYRRLAFNLAQSPRQGVTAICTALGDQNGLARIAGEDLSLVSLRGAESADAIEVRVRKLGDVLSEEGITHIDVLKIDVEGAEDKVLKSFLDECPDFTDAAVCYHRASWPTFVGFRLYRWL